MRVGDVSSTISTLGQLATAVGAEPPPGLPLAQEAADIIALLDGWVAHLKVFTWEFVSRPTPSRDRTVRELTVNVFGPLDILPLAWETGKLPWHPEDDEARGLAFASRDELVDWAAGVTRRWASFVGLEESAFEDSERVLESPRGTFEWGSFITSQRWHAAFHYRQLVEFADAEGVQRPRGAVELASLRDLALPPEIF